MDNDLWKSKRGDAWNFQYFEGYPSELLLIELAIKFEPKPILMNYSKFRDQSIPPPRKKRGKIKKQKEQKNFFPAPEFLTLPPLGVHVATVWFNRWK